MGGAEEGAGGGDFGFGADEFEACGFADFHLGLDALAEVLDEFEGFAGDFDFAAMAEDLVEGLFDGAANGEAGAGNADFAAGAGLFGGVDAGAAEGFEFEGLGEGVGLEGARRGGAEAVGAGELRAGEGSEGGVGVGAGGGDAGGGAFALGGGDFELRIIALGESEGFLEGERLNWLLGRLFGPQDEAEDRQDQQEQGCTGEPG